MTHIFISYSSHDKEKAARLAGRLRDAGFSVWMDDSNLTAASRWSTEIVQAIEECKVFIVLLSANSFGSHNVIKELSLASEGKKHIIPIELEDAIDLTHEVKYQLAGIQRASYREYERIEAAIRGFISDTIPAQSSPAKTTTKRSPILKYVFGILVAALAVAAYFLLPAKHDAPPAQPVAPTVQVAPEVKVKKLFVLPFESIGSSKEDESFTDGVTAQAIAALSGVSGFQTIDLKTSMNYKGRKGDLSAVAKELGANYIVEGTVQKKGKNVKVTSQLINADSGKVLLSEQFEGTSDDLSSLEGKLANGISTQLQNPTVHQDSLTPPAPAAHIDSAPPKKGAPKKPASKTPAKPKEKSGRDFDRIYN